MGHRKHSAPRRGSLAYRPRGRAKRFVPRVRTWPSLSSGSPVLLGFPTFKAGTIHAITTDDREKTPNFGKPLFNPATVLAVPEAEVVGVRLYARENGGERPIAEWRSNTGKVSEQEKIIGGWREMLGRVTRIAGIVSVVPREAGLTQKEPIALEMGVGGGEIGSQFEYATKLLGKKVKFSEVFKPGMYVDALAITKGKGFEGPVTRFGVKRKQHKSRKSVRAVGVIGPWHPAAVMYTVARAGQKGFQQRTETGKRRAKDGFPPSSLCGPGSLAAIIVLSTSLGFCVHRGMSWRMTPPSRRARPVLASSRHHSGPSSISLGSMMI